MEPTWYPVSSKSPSVTISGASGSHIGGPKICHDMSDIVRSPIAKTIPQMGDVYGIGTSIHPNKFICKIPWDSICG